MGFPVLSVITFTPITAGLLILLTPANRKTEVRVTALAAATFALILSLWVYFSYDTPAGGYQFVEQHSWLPQLGISYYVGVAGMNTPLVLLTGIVMFTGVLISWGINQCRLDLRRLVAEQYQAYSQPAAPAWSLFRSGPTRV